MTNAEKKAWLNRYRPLVREIRVLCEEYERVMSIGTKVTAVYSDMPKDGQHDKVQSTVERLAAVQSKVLEKTNEMSAVCEEIMEAVNAVPQEHLREILYRRYINGASFEEIAVTMNYSWRHTLRLHGVALGALTIKDVT